MMQNFKYEETLEIDPFYFYLHSLEIVPPFHAYLLDAAYDKQADTRFSRSILGLMPLIEVIVKDGKTFIYAKTGLAEWLAQELQPNVIEFEGSFVSAVAEKPCAVFTDNPLEVLERLRLLLRQKIFTENQPIPFSAGFLGYIGYDSVHYLEKLPKTTLDDRALPDIRLQLHAFTIHLQVNRLQMFSLLPELRGYLSKENMLLLESVQMKVLNLLDQGTSEEPRRLKEAAAASQDTVDIKDEVSAETFMGNVERAREYIRAGDIFQVVLSKRMKASATLHPYIAYDRLRKLNPSPYMFMSEYPDMRLFGASPEVQLRVVDGLAEMKPIAGTSKGRGKSAAEDRALAEQLLNDEKERAEHLMLVDLCRNDLGRVCTIGSVHVPDFMVVEPYSHLFHLVSTVRGQLREDVSVFTALLATFPAGTLSGAPKIRAMEIIDELETLRRGPYGGLLGMVDLDANANTAIIIRSVVEKNQAYYVQVGAGIVMDSVAEQEWQECNRKAGAILDILSQPMATQK
ncbi:anthranilate synthase component I family protein [Alicyclobacillus tolerans]|uniref:anthranilate synthase component I family protein n=1 Tax=Alicyclobacillus tolerans TaxID=90970 RepID=UPI003B7EEAB6